MDPLAAPHCDQTLSFSLNPSYPPLYRPFSPSFFSPSLSPFRSSSSRPTFGCLHRNSPNSEPSPSQSLNPFLRLTSLAAITGASALFLMRFWQMTFPGCNKSISLPPMESMKQEDLVTELLGDKLRQIHSVNYCKLKEKAQIVHELMKADAEAWQMLKTEVSGCKEKLESVKVGFEAILQKDPFSIKSYHDRVLEYLEMVDECEGLLKYIKMAMDKCERDNLDMEYHIRFYNSWIARVKLLEGDMVVALKHFQELEQQ